MSTEITTSVPQETEQPTGKPLAAGIIGNFIEWFEFGIYAFMAPLIAVNFFPEDNRTAGLLGTFGVFAVAFLVRPLGGFYFGRLGDTIGRRNVLAACLILMSVGTFAIGLLPTYASVGVIAPVLLLLCRLTQAFSAGGEFAGSASFVVEYAPEAKRARYASMVMAGVFAGFLCAVVLSAVLTVSLGEAAMGSWGWRAPFLLTLPLGIVGLYIRLKLQETPVFQSVRRNRTVSRAPIKDSFRTQWRPMFLVFGFTIASSVALYLLTAYMPTYLGEEIGLERDSALMASSVALLLMVLATPFAGMLADRIGRKPVLVTGCAGMVVLTIPALLVAKQGGLSSAILAQVMLAVPIIAVSGSIAVVLVEIFPPQLRYSAGSISWNLIQMLFGGTAPLVATALIAGTGDKISPAYYLTASAVISTAVAAFGFRERGRSPAG